jgi:CRP/FNR family transcriptional regulator, dissimilatory nitrate respiration regulator
MITIMSTEVQDVEEPSGDEPALAGFDKRLRAAARVLQRPAGAALFRTGERPAWMFYVRRGEAQMQRVTSSGTPVPLQRASRGFLAEASLTSKRYHCDAVCRIDCELLAFPLRALREAIDNDERTRWAWIGLLSAQSRQQRARIERLTLKTIRERLQHLLLSEGTDRGYEWPGTRMELAAELGVTPEAMYRALAALQAEGTLSIRGAQLRWRS